ncbi:hypothetical protein BG004_001733, partial [Podila humilis]
MQHATSAPQDALRKVGQVVTGSHGPLSLTELMLAPDVDDKYPPETEGGAGFGAGNSDKQPRKSFAKPDAQFTFESTPLPSALGTATGSPKNKRVQNPAPQTPSTNGRNPASGMTAGDSGGIPPASLQNAHTAHVQ